MRTCRQQNNHSPNCSHCMNSSFSNHLLLLLFLLLLNWRYNHLLVLVWSKIWFQRDLSCAVVFQFGTPSVRRSSCTPSATRHRERPARRCRPGSLFRSNVDGTRIRSMRTTCPAHLRRVLTTAMMLSSLKFKIVSSSPSLNFAHCTEYGAQHFAFKDKDKVLVTLLQYPWLATISQYRSDECPVDLAFGCFR